MGIKLWQLLALVLALWLLVSYLISPVLLAGMILLYILCAGFAILSRERHRYNAQHPKTKSQLSFGQRVHLASLTSTYGALHPQVVCPHCQTRGAVRVKREKQKQGVSGGKATAALLTGGVSLLATGLSRKGWVTQAHCGNCGVTSYI